MSSLQTQIEYEIASGLTKRCDKTFTSTARTVLRLMWYLDFESLLIEGLLNNPYASMREICSDAYKHSLAPHHHWPVRQIAKLGMFTLHNRDEFESVVLGPNRTLQEKRVMLASILDRLNPLRDTLWDYYKHHNLLNLP